MAVAEKAGTEKVQLQSQQGRDMMVVVVVRC